MPIRGSTLTLPIPRDFHLPRAVCSYGYFLLAPNHWDPQMLSLTRPLHGRRDRLVNVAISQSGERLRLRCDRRVNRDEAASIKRQVARMLRVDDDFADWYRLHPAARRQKFGRLFRSPTLFEDIVKTITSCNVAWPNTRRMNALLCEHVGGGGFPTSKQLARVTPGRLKKACKVGYRAERIVRLARGAASGKLDLDWFEKPQRTSDDLYEQLLTIHGIGPYAAANLCQLLGHYDRLAIDTETYRHFCEAHGVRRPKNPLHLHRRIERHYARYAPYQFLAYWHEIWGGYERFVGKRSQDWQHDDGGAFTAANYA